MVEHPANSMRNFMKLMESPDENEMANRIITKTINDRFDISGTWSLNSNGSVDVQGSVKLKDRTKLSRIPFAFGNVTDNFNVAHSGLKSLVGAPTTVGKSMAVTLSQITNLVGCPTEVGLNLYLSHNDLTSLEGLPSTIGGIVYLDWAQNLPLLRLVGKMISMHGSPQPKAKHANTVDNIINKFHTDSSRLAILTCQKELIAAGYEGNASW